MDITTIQGNLKQEGFFIFAAADSKYFDEYAKPLINSVLANTPNYGVHIHIYDPRPDQIEFCNSKQKVSCTYEYIDHSQFELVANYWLSRTAFSNERQRQMYKKGKANGRPFLLDLVKKTYYACVRFIRLNEILKPDQSCLAIDVDGLVRKPFTYKINPPADFYLYEKPKDGTHLAGALLFTGNAGSVTFLNEYAAEIKTNINQNELYWFLDQLILDTLVHKYAKGLLPMSYIDWAMKLESSIWSAKGPRKELAIFKEEQRKYK